MADTPYGISALTGEIDKLEKAQPGQRNSTLNTVAFKLGQLVEAGHLDQDTARLKLFETVRPWIGKPGGDGRRPFTGAEAAATIASGLNGGQSRRRPNLPEPADPYMALRRAGGRPLPTDPAYEFLAPGQAPPPADTATSATMPLEFLTLAELRAKVTAAGPRKWLLRGVWPAADYGVHGAEMKAQKTWNAVDLAVSVASGTPWLGAIEVDNPGPVIMFAGEGSEANLLRRIDAVCAPREIDPDTLQVVICARAPKLGSNEHMAIMWGKVHELRPVLVTLDPFYLSARGGKLGDLYEMGELLERAQHTCQDHGAALFVVTHHNRNTHASGALRITGAGPAEWGRVLITGEVRSRRTDPDSLQSTVVAELEVIGGEVPGGTWRVTRRIRADDPADLNSPLRYQVTAVEHEPDDNGGDQDMPPVRRKLLAAVRVADGPRTIRQLQDWLADPDHGDGIVPKRTTCSEHLNALMKAGLVDEIDPGQGRAKEWIVVEEGVSGEPVGGVATPDR
jgi:hypothetical protein